MKNVYRIEHCVIYIACSLMLFPTSPGGRGQGGGGGGAGYSKAGTYPCEYPRGGYPKKWSEYPGVLSPTFRYDWQKTYGYYQTKEYNALNQSTRLNLIPLNVTPDKSMLNVKFDTPKCLGAPSPER